MKKLIENYKFTFDIVSFLLVIGVMLPNIIWFIVPAQNDVLRNESITPITDTIASIFQVILLFSLCAIKQRDFSAKFSWKSLMTVICLVGYFISWVLYYCSEVSDIVILALCILPCLCFFFHILDRKKYLSLAPLLVFSVCHLIFALKNFVL